MGYVYLRPQSEFADTLPPIYIPADTSDNRAELTLRGAIYSPELAGLIRRAVKMLKNGTFKPGEKVNFG
jgi:hypothetical protein